MTGSFALAVGVLAQQAPKETGPDFGKASPVGLLVLVLLLIGTGLLVWSMNRHLRKLPQSFAGEDAEQPAEDAEQPADDAGDSGDDAGAAESDPLTEKTRGEPDG